MKLPIGEYLLTLRMRLWPLSHETWIFIDTDVRTSYIFRHGGYLTKYKDIKFMTVKCSICSANFATINFIICGN